MSLLEGLSTPLTDRAEWQPAEVRRVVVRLLDGTCIQAGTAVNRHGAMALARSVTAELDRVDAWPTIAGRTLDPASVVSVDVVAAGER